MTTPPETSPKTPKRTDGADHRLGRDIRIRAIAATVMGVLALAVTIAGPWPFAVAVCGIAAIAAWEWQRITRDATALDDPWFLLHAATIILAVLVTAAGYPFEGMIVVSVVTIAITLLRQSGFAGAGLLVVGLPALALTYLRCDTVAGLRAVLFVFVVVWTTDTAALVFGRAIGGPKLWPEISPNKTWAGALGGASTAILAGGGFAVAAGLPAIGWILLVATALTIASQASDLAISGVKRRFGRKDASRLIPGHGGILDRIDGLLAAATVAAIVGGALNFANPGAGLLGLR